MLDGYEVFGSIEDHPPGHTRFWMRKRFEGAGMGTVTVEDAVG